VVAALTEYDPDKNGFLVTFKIEEGQQYRVGTVKFESSIANFDGNSLASISRVSVGSIYNVESLEKSVEEMQIEASRRGYAFAVVHPRGDRNFDNHTVSVVFAIDEGVRAYIERINIRGNTRTLDYVIRREFDISEGDAYNRALVDRAERRIRNLNFFKNVKITNEPGSAPDRVVINVLVEEQSTGEFSVMGGFSTANGWMAQASVAEHNLFGTGRFAKTSVTYGQYVRAAELSFVEPYLLDQRISGGIDLFARQTLANTFLSYGTETFGGSLKLGVPLREDLSLQLRYSLFSQKITLPSSLDDCQNINPDFVNTFPTPIGITAAAAQGRLWPGYNGTTIGCFASSQASLPVRVELADGAFLTSLAGYGLTYNTLDNNKHPTGGMLLSFGQDFAGLGGDVAYMRTVADFRTYYEIVSDLVGILHLQGGNMIGLNGSEVRMLDDFKMGPNLVRGFQPAGIGPRDLTPGTTGD